VSEQPNDLQPNVKAFLEKLAEIVAERVLEEITQNQRSLEGLPEGEVATNRHRSKDPARR